MCAALELLKIAKGSRIGLPAISYDYVNAAIIKSGYVPIFIDIVPQTGIMNGQLALPGNTNPIYTYPRRGIDSFLESYKSRYIMLHVAWQLIIQKIW